MLKQLDNLTEFNWILERINEQLPKDGEGRQGHFISDCLPSTFESYCKIFHPIFVDRDSLDTPLNTQKDIKDKNEQAEKIAEYVLVNGDIQNPNFHVERIRWKELAEQHGLKFHSEISDYSFLRAFDYHLPQYLIGPNEGTLDKKTCRNIVSVLTPFTGPQICFFEYFLMATEKIEDDLLFMGNLSDVQESFSLETVQGGSPTYWWPQDRSWCLCTDWDLCFTILGGTKEIIENVLTHKELEALSVEPHVRVDYHGDQINFPD